MNTIKGPGIFLAQFLRDSEPYNNIDSISEWVASLGYKGIQVPTWDTRVFDLDKAASSRTYCDEYKGKREEAGLEVIELAAYLQGQVMAVHPAYELLRGDAEETVETWGQEPTSEAAGGEQEADKPLKLELDAQEAPVPIPELAAIDFSKLDLSDVEFEVGMDFNFDLSFGYNTSDGFYVIDKGSAVGSLVERSRRQGVITGADGGSLT